MGDDFISLGQEDHYYNNLYRVLPKQAEQVLLALRDIAWMPALATDFEPTAAFRNAMMRENSARRARRFGYAWAIGETVTENLAFSYSGAIDGAAEPIDVEIPFDAKDLLPGRVVGIIGRNASGKTAFLAKLSQDLAQISRTSAERLADRESRFAHGRPLFTRIIAVSYSAFDRFKRPPRDDPSSSYIYCSIRNDKGTLSHSSLTQAYRKNQDRIRTLGYQSMWLEHMRTILGYMSDSLTQVLELEISAHAQDDQTLSLLSSWQSILCHFVTALLAWIQPNSLILFDEPETHLHPNAIASIFLVLTDILRKFDSYAILATHSATVIQEIPAKRVVVFQRSGNITSAEPLALESFGEIVTELTRHVFETIDVESRYRNTLKKLASKEPAAAVLARFERGLSLNAQAYLLAQYGNDTGNKL